jgi:hypothetical protein
MRATNEWTATVTTTTRKAKRKKTNHRSLLPGVFEKTQEV